MTFDAGDSRSLDALVRSQAEQNRILERIATALERTVVLAEEAMKEDGYFEDKEALG